MSRLTYVGSHDEVEVPSVGVVCKRGETVEVPNSLAGRAPRAAQAAVPAEGDELLENGKKNPKYKPEVPAVEADPGEGLLAQPDNWQPAATPAADNTPEV